MLELLYNTFQSVVKDITNPLVVPVINFCKSFVYTFDLVILSHFIRNITLLEAIIISDGLYNGLKFTQEYILYKVKTKLILNKNDNQDIKQELLKNYNNLYTLNIIDRYILYCLLYCVVYVSYLVIWCWNILLLYDYNSFNQFIDNTFFTIVLLFVFPYIQNIVLKLKTVNNYVSIYLTNKKIFIKYSLSKLIINFIKNLNLKIDFVKNSEIFILYKYLCFELLIEFIKSYVFIYFLYFLRNKEQTYYYYKMIKLAYYYNSGHLFNQITPEESIYIIKIFITEKRWHDISNLEIVHAFYTLINEKYKNKDNIYTTLNLYIAKFFTLWSFICLLKILKTNIITLLLITYCIIDYNINTKNTNNKGLNNKSIIERYGIILILYFLLLVNTNDLVISTVCVLYKIIYLIYLELVFFINNINDIKKVLKFYEKQTKQLKLKSKENLKSKEIVNKF